MVLPTRRAVHLRADRRARQVAGRAWPTARCCCGSWPQASAAATCPDSAAAKGRLPGDTGASAAEMDGFPIHEIVGEVHRQPAPEHRAGDRVVGWASGFDGLMEQVVADGNGLAPLRPGAEPRSTPSALQPLACVLYAVEQLPDLAGRRGRGASGRARSDCCSPMSAKAAGAAHVTGVDPVDRDAIGQGRSGWTPWCARPATGGSATSTPNAKPDIVIEAVGHQVATLGHAVEAAAFGGTVFYFGVPDDDSYPISMRTMLRNNLTLKSGVTLDRRRVLERADAFAREHPDLLADYLTHTFGVRRGAGRVRTGLPTRSRNASRSRSCLNDGTSRLQEPWPPRRRCGAAGWSGPTIMGPEEFAQAGYDYVGFDVQHGYLDDADVALMLRRLEHVPIATAVRLPSADPAPIGRVLDAGADARHHRDGRVGRAGRRRGRRDPVRARRGAQLRAAAGEPGHRPGRAGGAGAVFAMIETARGLAALDEICAVAGPGRRLRRARRPGDLAWGTDSPTHGPQPEVPRRDGRASRPRARAAGLVAGIHAGAGTLGNAMAEMGFRMITLASESQALRRGAAAHLAEASANRRERRAPQPTARYT